MATLTLSVSDDLAQAVAALSDAERAAYFERFNALAVAALPAPDNAPDADEEPVDRAFVAELREAFAEAQQIGTISYEDLVKQIKATGPDWVDATRAQVAAYHAARNSRRATK